jgi:hypothetical protein
MLDPELEKILRKHADSWQIYSPEWDGVILLKTEVKNDILIQEVSDYVNRSAMAFGLIGPYVVEWSPLEDKIQ